MIPTNLRESSQNGTQNHDSTVTKNVIVSVHEKAKALLKRRLIKGNSKKRAHLQMMQVSEKKTEELAESREQKEGDTKLINKDQFAPIPG